MTEQKEFESLDELFRKTFDNLPETPAASGWDTPSERVWQHVQEQIKPPQSGWSAQTLTLIAAFSVIIAVGLYFLFNRPADTETLAPPAPAAATESTQQTSAAADTQQEAQIAMPSAETATPKADAPVKTLKQQRTAENRAVPKNNTELEAAEAKDTDSSSEKPGSPKRNMPNTTLRLKAELAKRAEEAWKKELDPLPQRWPGQRDH